MGETNLLFDSIFEILSLLPVKSLLRFESVSKSWCSLIHNPLFITSHLQQAAKTSSSSTLISLSGLKICLSGVDSPGKNLMFDYKSHPQVDQNHPGYGRPVNLIGSCNGLLCLSVFHRYVIISNLLIKDQYIITQFPGNLPDENQYHPYYYGFGYDSVNDDYKVLVLVLCRELEYSCPCAKTTIYSLRSNSWSQPKRWDSIRGRKDFPGFVNSRDASCITDGGLASGALHWLMGNRDSQNIFCPLIVAFNLTAEDFYCISLPDNVDKEVQLTKGMMGRYLRLGVLKGCLCISTGASGGKPYHDIWIMERYNIQSSWTKLLRFNLEFWLMQNCVTPLVYSASEDRVLLLEERRQGLRWYDLRNKQVVGKCSMNNYLTNCNDPFPFTRFYTDSVCLNTLVSLDDYKALWKDDDSSSNGRKRKRTTNDDDVGNHVRALEVFFTFRDKFSSFVSEC